MLRQAADRLVDGAPGQQAIDPYGVQFAEPLGTSDHLPFGARLPLGFGDDEDHRGIQSAQVQLAGADVRRRVAGPRSVANASTTAC